MLSLEDRDCLGMEFCVLWVFMLPHWASRESLPRGRPEAPPNGLELSCSAARVFRLHSIGTSQAGRARIFGHQPSRLQQVDCQREVGRAA